MQSRGKFWINYFDKKKINQFHKVYFMKKKNGVKFHKNLEKMLCLMIPIIQLLKNI